MFAKLIVVLVLTSSTQAFAAGGAALDHAEIDPGNIASLQRGARNFMNYCSGCHSAKYVRYKTIGKYLELSEEQLIDNLMFNAEKTFETINTSMPAGSAERWFGVAPPDLSLMARSKGADYIYSFLRGFYVDPDSPTGVDNTVLPGTSMPHVLWELQGFQAAKISEHTDEGATTAAFRWVRTAQRRIARRRGLRRVRTRHRKFPGVYRGTNSFRAPQAGRLGADVPDLFLDHRRNAQEANLEGRQVDGSNTQ